FDSRRLHHTSFKFNSLGAHSRESHQTRRHSLSPLHTTGGRHAFVSDRPPPLLHVRLHERRPRSSALPRDLVPPKRRPFRAATPRNQPGRIGRPPEPAGEPAVSEPTTCSSTPP